MSDTDRDYRNKISVPLTSSVSVSLILHGQHHLFVVRNLNLVGPKFKIETTHHRHTNLPNGIERLGEKRRSVLFLVLKLGRSMIRKSSVNTCLPEDPGWQSLEHQKRKNMSLPLQLTSQTGSLSTFIIPLTLRLSFV